jgi:L-threonylcarbamoyladenylate synthase
MPEDLTATNPMTLPPVLLSRADVSGMLARLQGRIPRVTQFVYVKPRSRSGTITLSEVAKVADSLKRGSLAVLPTETGYLLAALATSTDATKRAFTVKDRAPSDVMHVACASLEMAETVGILTARAIRLLGEFTPGPLSVIVKKTDLLPDHMVTLNETVGIRIPDHPGTLQVINAVGAPVTATSLNSSGSRLASVDEASLQSLNWPDDEVIYVLRHDDAIVYGSPSTLVRISGEPTEILRPGPISESEVRRVAATISYLETAD